MDMTKEIQYILRRISRSDLKQIVGQAMMDQMPCYYKAKYSQAGLGMFYHTVINDTADVIFHRLSDYNILSDDESTEEEEINIINKGLEEMFTDIIKDYYRNQDCEDYGIDNSDFINESKYDKKHIKKILKEETKKTEFEVLERAVKKMINFLTKDIEFPENFYDFMVDIIEDKRYNEKILKITTVMKKPFSQEDTDRIDAIKRNFMPQIKSFFKGMFDSVSGGGTSTLEIYLRDKERDNQIPNF